jgi:hypothetical protein
MVPHWAAPCIMGGITMKTRPPPDAAARSAIVNSLVTRSPVTASMPCPSAKYTSSWRHITPLGMPVVPPV